jgi:hypothetical protein
VSARAKLLTSNLLALGLAAANAAIAPSFSIQEQQGTSWLIKPNGKRFFSLGVCVVDQGASRNNYNPTNPGYAAFQNYENSTRWAEATLQRLRSWNFTTIGGWSDYEALKQCRDAEVAFTPMLAVGMTCGLPWVDMWDTNVIARMHEVARKHILAVRDDPRLLGYYSDNEMGWWNGILFKMTLEQSPGSGQRQRLIQLLRETYHDDWSELLKDFEPEGVANFDELDHRGVLYLRPGSEGIRTYRRFLALMAERYYSLARDVISAYDTRGLILGERYQSFYYPEVARASRSYVDVASGNLNAAWSDGSFPRFYLETLHALTRKPVIVSEFYMAARQNRSGNKNEPGIYPSVATQEERALGFRHTLKALARTPFVVGADWFQYFDEPTHGREDGENWNFGLVDIHDKPYRQLTAAAAAVNPSKVKSQPVFFRTDASHGVPPAPKDPLGNFEPLLALKHWDRERGFVKPISDAPVADLYVCWNSKAIYLGLYAQDIVETAYYRSKTLPEIDRAEWAISAGETNLPIRIRIGPGATPVRNDSDLRLACVSGIYLNTRSIVAIEIPARRFARERFRPGDSINLTSTFFTHCRSDHVEWKGRFILRR